MLNTKAIVNYNKYCLHKNKRKTIVNTQCEEASSKFESVFIQIALSDGLNYIFISIFDMIYMLKIHFDNICF